MPSSLGSIVLIGANGMLGQALRQVLSGSNLTALTHTDLDITQRTTVLDYIQKLRPQYIINAAGYTKVDDCETQSAVANLINGAAVEFLTAAAQSVDATIIHYSTDYVFSGRQINGYTETDQPDQPINAYGKSKLLGERAIQRYANHYLIRTAWLFGQHGPNFVDTMLKLGKTHTTVRVVNDQHGSPTYVADLATATAELLMARAPFGTYHLTNAGVCTWYQFAQVIFSTAKLPITVHPCTSAEFPRPAQRPQYSILLNTKRPALRAWQDALTSYVLSLTSSGKA